jgi:hypothetical protein
MKRFQVTALILLMGGIAIALWWGFRPEPPPPSLTVRLLNVTNPPTGPAAAVLLVSNSCERVVRVFGPQNIEFRPPPVLPARKLISGSPVILAAHEAASFQISPMPTQTWRTGFNYGDWTIEDPGMWFKERIRVRRWLDTRGVPLAGKSLAPYHRYSEWISP